MHTKMIDTQYSSYRRCVGNRIRFDAGEEWSIRLWGDKKVLPTIHFVSYPLLYL